LRVKDKRGAREKAGGLDIPRGPVGIPLKGTLTGGND